jgi:RNA polymerase sigma-70 factor (ECF subfamily)
MLEESSLRRWIEEAKAGDFAAFERLLLQHERQVLRTALRLLGNSEDARDVAQEVFIRLHKHLGAVRENEELIRWLYRTTVNLCIDAHRRSRRRPAGAEPRELIDQSLDPEALAAHAQHRALISEALDTLTPKERAAIVLRDLENRTTTEAALILGSSEATVRSHISSARIKIRQFVDAKLGRGK